MAAFAILLTFIVLLIVLAAGGWAALLLRHRMAFLEDGQRRNSLASIEDSHRFERQFEELALRLDAAERRANDTMQRPLQSVNYTQRSQMLRMVRRGDEADQISNILGVPVNQVRLLMKLPGLGREPPGRGPSGAG